MSKLCFFIQEQSVILQFGDRHKLKYIRSNNNKFTFGGNTGKMKTVLKGKVYHVYVDTKRLLY